MRLSGISNPWGRRMWQYKPMERTHAAIGHLHPWGRRVRQNILNVWQLKESTQQTIEAIGMRINMKASNTFVCRSNACCVLFRYFSRSQCKAAALGLPPHGLLYLDRPWSMRLVFKTNKELN